MLESIRTFLRFSRLHTIIGTSLSVSTLYLMASAFSKQQDLGLWVLALISCLGANIYIVGLNQITDVEIDRINKPYLPLASGAYSMATGFRIILLSLFVSILLAIQQGPFLALTVLLSLLLGTAYSLPPIRLKRFHLWAAFCILAVRGLIVNLFLFLHFYSRFTGQIKLPIDVLLLTAMIFLFGVVIAWFKDIPDAEGDAQYQIRTLTLKLGARQVWLVGSALLSIGFLGISLASWWFDLQMNTYVLAGANVLFFLLFWWMNGQLNLRVQASIARYYQSVWVLFFLEYVCFAVAAYW